MGHACPVKRMSIICVFLVCLGTSSIDAETGEENILLKLDVTLGAKSTGEDWYQMAIWIEDSEGHFIETLYVTEAIGRKGLGNAYIKLLGFTVRAAPESLPVWAHTRNVRYGDSYYPSKNEPLPDAITGATVKSNRFIKTFTVSAQRLQKLSDNHMVCRIEINAARDGVPSMVFECNVPDSPGVADRFTFVGYGDNKGRNGEVSSNADSDAKTSDYLKRLTVAVGPTV